MKSRGRENWAKVKYLLLISRSLLQDGYARWDHDAIIATLPSLLVMTHGSASLKSAAQSALVTPLMGLLLWYFR